LPLPSWHSLQQAWPTKITKVFEAPQKGTTQPWTKEASPMKGEKGVAEWNSKKSVNIAWNYFTNVWRLTRRIEMNERSRVTKSTFWGSSERYLKFVLSITQTRSSRRILSATWCGSHCKYLSTATKKPPPRLWCLKVAYTIIYRATKVMILPVRVSCLKVSYTIISRTKVYINLL